MRCGAGQFRGWPVWKFRANDRLAGNYYLINSLRAETRDCSP